MSRNLTWDFFHKDCNGAPRILITTSDPLVVSSMAPIWAPSRTTGSFFSVGGGGADIGVAQVAGTVSSLALLNKGGASLNVSLGPISGSLNFSLGNKSATFAGFSFGAGKGRFKFGASATAGSTRLYGCKVRGQ